jgi:dipeptidyl aminopeptidase/acylaminoacyl peptidase
VREDYRRIPGGTPGPLGLVAWSPDGRWLLFYIDPMNSPSIAADGLDLQALRVADGRRVRVAHMLLYDDYMTWCGSKLVLTAGGDRRATHNKRLLVVSAPDWKPRPLWVEPKRAFGSVVCAPDRRSVAVLSQPASRDYNFFHTRWQLWRVRLDGSRRLLDAPPPGWADESPRWGRSGSLFFVRERRGRGTLMLLGAGALAKLGYSLGYYGHHDWSYRPG